MKKKRRGSRLRQRMKKKGVIGAEDKPRFCLRPHNRPHVDTDLLLTLQLLQWPHVALHIICMHTIEHTLHIVQQVVHTAEHILL